MVAQIPGRANERLHHTGHLLSGILYHKMTTDARLMILVRACGAPNPAKNEYGKLELVGAKPLHLATQDRSVT